MLKKGIARKKKSEGKKKAKPPLGPKGKMFDQGLPYDKPAPDEEGYIAKRVKGDREDRVKDDVTEDFTLTNLRRRKLARIEVFPTE